jgi:hypothetical protein
MLSSGPLRYSLSKKPSALLENTLRMAHRNYNVLLNFLKANNSGRNLRPQFPTNERLNPRTTS